MASYEAEVASVPPLSESKEKDYRNLSGNNDLGKVIFLLFRVSTRLPSSVGTVSRCLSAPSPVTSSRSDCDSALSFSRFFPTSSSWDIFGSTGVEHLFLLIFSIKRKKESARFENFPTVFVIYSLFLFSGRTNIISQTRLPLRDNGALMNPLEHDNRNRSVVACCVSIGFFSVGFLIIDLRRNRIIFC